MEQENFIIPQHVAIIMDGNGRWAKKRFMPRNVGHIQGSKVVEKICEEAYNMGVKYLTVYAFSTENWRRPKEEIDALMKLLRTYLKDCLKTSKKNNMRVKIIGDISPLSEDIKDTILELQEISKENTGLVFQVALNYGSRNEMVRGIRKLVQEYEENGLQLEDIDEDFVGNHLDTQGVPDPDLLIRTSGEQRLSNFLLWQLAYTEFYFTDVYWPDFNKEELKKAIEYYNGRSRRYGSV